MKGLQLFTKSEKSALVRKSSGLSIRRQVRGLDTPLPSCRFDNKVGQKETEMPPDLSQKKKEI